MIFPENRNRRGFTLIELLVVITIIGILAALLIPVLSSVREQAHRVVCTSNLREIYVGTQLYVNDHRDSLPPYRSDNPATVPYLPWRYYMAFDGGPAVRYNLANLFAKGYIDDPRVFYCPSQRHQAFTWEHNSGHWLSGSREERVRTGYLFNPENKNGEFRRLGDFREQTVLAMDIVHYNQNIPHLKTAGWNLLFFDGSIRFKRNYDVREAIPSGDLSFSLFEELLQKLKDS